MQGGRHTRAGVRRVIQVDDAFASAEEDVCERGAHAAEAADAQCRHHKVSNTYGCSSGNCT